MIIGPAMRPCTTRVKYLRPLYTKNNASMEMLLNSVNWVEIPVTDFDRAKKFYSVIYDYEMPEMQMGPNRMGFCLIVRRAVWVRPLCREKIMSLRNKGRRFI